MNHEKHQLPRVAAGLASKRHRRTTLWMIRRAVRDGWVVEPRQRDELCRLAMDAGEQASQEKDDRAVIAGGYTFLAFADHNLRVAVEMDRLERAMRQADEQERCENMVFGEIEFGCGRIDPRNGSPLRMEPRNIPHTSES